MAEFFECGVEWGHFFGVLEKSTKLGFSSRGEDHFHDDGEIEDCAVEDVEIRFVSKVEAASLSAAGSDSIEVGGVTVNHVAGMVANGTIGVGGTMVEKLVGGTFGGFHGGGWVRRVFAEGCENGGVNGMTIKRKVPMICCR